MSVLRTARRATRRAHHTAPAPAPIVLRATCGTTGCGYRATRTVVGRDGLTDRCEGCANEGTVRGWWESVGGAL